MNKRSAIRNPRSQIVVVGAGPAGSSLAIRLARAGFETTLIERERFPRQKLCGEFISPECFTHFRDLGVLDEMLDAGGDRIFETHFFELGGHSTVVPSNWLAGGEPALSLSRAEMDLRLLEHARSAGVTVIDGAAVTGVELDDGRIAKLMVRTADRDVIDAHADLFIDATGRSRAVARLAERSSENTRPPPKPGYVGFKTHLADVGPPTGVCEIYSFRGGYAGLSNVEGGLSNLCFILKAKTVRSAGGGAGELVERVLKQNKRAAQVLSRPIVPSKWTAVSIEGFGAKSAVPATNLFAVGDAASFIDPFTGSGMFMALEGADLLAKAIIEGEHQMTTVAETYAGSYRQRFSGRLRICSLLRRTAFMPRAATATVALLGGSSLLRHLVARRTRL